MRGFRKKRVLFLMKTNAFAGAEIRIFNVLEHVDYEKVEVSLCLSENHIPASLLRKFPEVKIATFPFHEKGGWKNVLRTCRPDQVIFCKTWISNFSLAYFLAAWAYTRGDIHMVEFTEAPKADTIKTWFGFLPGLGLWKWKYALKARLVKSTITMSQVLKERLARDYGYPRDRTHVSYADMDWEKFRPQEGKDFHKRRAQGIPEDDIVIIAVGRLCKEKAIDKSIAAFAGVLKATGRKDLWLWIFGQGPQEQELRNLAEREGVADRVLFPGFKEEIERYFQESNIFIHTADNEASGTVFIEAVAVGLLCLLTDSNCGAEEYFRGYKYKVENSVAALTRGLIEVVGMDRNTLQEFALEFREGFLREYRDPRWNEIAVVKREWDLPMKSPRSLRENRLSGQEPGQQQ